MVNGHYDPEVRMDWRRSDQTHICLALPGLSLNDPDRYNLTILNVILGDGMSSRLFQSLREVQGLAYDVSSSNSHFRDCGALTIYCGVEPKKSRLAVQGIVQELKGMHQEVPEQEITKAREYTKGRLLLRMEDTRAVSGWLASQELLQGEVATPDEVVQRIDEVTSEDVARVAERLIQPELLRMAVVGPHRSQAQFLKLLHF